MSASFFLFGKGRSPRRGGALLTLLLALAVPASEAGDAWRKNAEPARPAEARVQVQASRPVDRGPAAQRAEVTPVREPAAARKPAVARMPGGRAPARKAAKAKTADRQSAPAGNKGEASVREALAASRLQGGSSRREAADALLTRAGQTYTVVATGYTAGVESTGKRPGHPQYGITYSGVKVRRGKLSTIAADPELFPLGTVLYVPGYGYGVVADIGSRIKGRKIDLYFPSRKQVFREWGKRTVEVKVIREGKGVVTESMFQAIRAALFQASSPPARE